MTKLKKDRHTQAKKAERQTIKHRKHNILIKNKIKRTLKKLDNAINLGKTAEAKKLLSSVMEILQTSSRKKIIHENTASRKISQLSKKINSLKE